MLVYDLQVPFWGISFAIRLLLTTPDGAPLVIDVTRVPQQRARFPPWTYWAGDGSVHWR